MKQTNVWLPVYAADNSAVCSALYELGGLIVMHDASGCNSTYTTHDEPRWFDRPADVFITGLTEADAVLGNEQRMMDDIAAAAREVNPEFIAIAGTPIPMMMGCDYDGIARELESRTGVVSFGVDTNGTLDYVSGAGKAFVKLAERFVKPAARKTPHPKLRVNVTGVTPLDWSVNGAPEAIESFLNDAGFTVQSNWAMGENAALNRIASAAEADVTLAVTASGIPPALWLYEHAGVPFVIGAPVGDFMAQTIAAKLTEAAHSAKNINLASDCRGNWTGNEAPQTWVIGEAVTSAALRAALVKEKGLTRVAVATPLTAPDFVLGPRDVRNADEDTFRTILPKAKSLIADPFYGQFVKKLTETPPSVTDLPQEGLSGRIWRSAVPNLIGHRFSAWLDARSNRAPLL